MPSGRAATRLSRSGGLVNDHRTRPAPQRDVVARHKFGHIKKAASRRIKTRKAYIHIKWSLSMPFSRLDAPYGSPPAPTPGRR